MDAIQAIIGFLNEFWVKTPMMFIGQWLARQHPKIVTESGTFWTGIYSIGTAILANLAGVPAGVGPLSQGEAVFSFAAATAASAIPWWQSLLFNGILPWLIGLGGNRAPSHLSRLATGKTMIPVMAAKVHPFQTVLSDAQVERVEEAQERSEVQTTKVTVASDKAEAVADKADAKIEAAAARADAAAEAKKK